MVQEEEIVRTDRTLENSKIHRSSSGYARPQSTVTSNADNHLQNELAKMNTNLILKKVELEKIPQNRRSARWPRIKNQSLPEEISAGRCQIRS